MKKHNLVINAYDYDFVKKARYLFINLDMYRYSPGDKIYLHRLNEGETIPDGEMTMIIDSIQRSLFDLHESRIRLRKP